MTCIWLPACIFSLSITSQPILIWLQAISSFLHGSNLNVHFFSTKLSSLQAAFQRVDHSLPFGTFSLKDSIAVCEWYYFWFPPNLLLLPLRLHSLFPWLLNTGVSQDSILRSHLFSFYILILGNFNQSVILLSSFTYVMFKLLSSVQTWVTDIDSQTVYFISLLKYLRDTSHSKYPECNAQPFAPKQPCFWCLFHFLSPPYKLHDTEPGPVSDSYSTYEKVSKIQLWLIYK